MSKSCAEIATGWQGTENFPGHDIYQNGIIRDDCTRIYMAGWQNDWARATYIDDKGIEHLAASGYFTDQATIDSCMNGEKLNTNELDSALQTNYLIFQHRHMKMEIRFRAIFKHIQMFQHMILIIKDWQN